jgi:hypothetical protein
LTLKTDWLKILYYGEKGDWIFFLLPGGVCVQSGNKKNSDKETGAGVSIQMTKNINFFRNSRGGTLCHGYPFLKSDCGMPGFL